jgi:hypothetical protein
MTNTTINATYTNATDITVTYGNQNTINVTAPISTASLGGFATSVVYDGSACTGTDGYPMRTLTHSKTLGINTIVMRNRAFLIPNIDYTKSGTIITFLIYIDNQDKILVMT